jgi:hypothetical protein
MEVLEDRRVLASVMVTNNSDVTNAPNLTSIAALIANNGGDGVSLREAVMAANADAALDLITFDANNPALNGGQILLMRANGQLNISTSVTIDATALPNRITIKGEDLTPGLRNDGLGIRLFNITDPSSGSNPPLVTFVGMNLTGADPSLGPFGQAAPQGGAIRSEGILTLQNMTIYENGADFGAGVFLAVAGVASPRDVLIVENSRIDANSAFGDGGGVFVQFASTAGGEDSVRLTGSSVSNNVAWPRGSNVPRGAGLFITGAFHSDLNHSVIASSTAINTNFADSGGGIFHESDAGINLSILSGSSLSGNGARTGSGGGLYARGFGSTHIAIEDSTISGNTSAVNGGGVAAELNESSSLTVKRSTLNGNTSSAPQSKMGGGAISAKLRKSTYFASSLVIEDSVISGNTANADGGGVFAKAYRNSANPFPANRAITIARSTISGNTALNRGGGLYALNYGGTETLVEESRITGNHVPYSTNTQATKRNGGGIYAYVSGYSGNPANKPRWTLSRSTVDNNDALMHGGGIFVCGKFYGEFIGTNSTITGNRTTDPLAGAGGGMFIARFGPPDDMTESIDAHLRNMTVTKNNSVSGGGIGTPDIQNVRLRIGNSIISDNFNLPEGNPSRVPNNLVGRIMVGEFKHNLVGTGSTFLDHSTGSPTSVPAANLNITSDAPLLRPLADNGGPTPTHAPRYEPQSSIISPAIDAGDNDLAKHPLTGADLPSDQRGTGSSPGGGFTRIFDITGVTLPGRDPVDIGAYEIGLAKVINVVISTTIATNQTAHPPFHFKTVDGSGLQIRTVPVAAANKVAVHFSEDVTNIAQNSLVLHALRTGTLQQVAGGGYEYSTASGAAVATWRYSMQFLPNHYRLSLSDSVTNRNGNALDGEWTNPFSITTVSDAVSEFPSGNGQAGGAFNFAMTFLNGDASLNNSVDGADYLIWLANNGGSGGFTAADFSGNGQVGYEDYTIWTNNFGKTLFSLVLADFNHDNKVDNVDWLIWQSNFGLTGATHAQGDADLDGDVDNSDLQVWQNQNFLQLAWVA